MSNENMFGETIYSYSRAQAIDDGVLVDLSQADSIRQHWKHPFACTSAVWAIIEEALEKSGQDVSGICHDISTMAKLAIRGEDAAHEAEQIRFHVIITGQKHALKLHIGPGDTAAPVLTRSNGLLILRTTRSLSFAITLSNWAGLRAAPSTSGCLLRRTFPKASVRRFTLGRFRISSRPPTRCRMSVTSRPAHLVPNGATGAGTSVGQRSVRLAGLCPRSTKFFSMPKPDFSVAIPSDLNTQIVRHLIRKDRQEDLCFALWAPSQGKRRLSALINKVILPADGDRQVHGNVSFNPQYLERVCAIACRAEMGIAFLHSHPAPGWQGMSRDDVVAERRMASAVEALTGLPLVGLTCGSDGIWSARFWQSKKPEAKADQICWCRSARAVGEGLSVSFNEQLDARPNFQELFKRTVTVWGAANHANLGRLRIGIVGLGSVGSLVAETLARMGMKRFVLIDFDEVQPHNLDRLLGATKRDIGRLKVDIASRQIQRAATAHAVEITRVPHSLAEEEGYRNALDCDVLFSCVDRPRARSILNHLAYAHLIPVIDGGIQVRFKKGEFSGADWQLQTVAPNRPCLDCLGAFDPTDVETEKAGLFDDPSYLAGLARDHRFKSNENVFPFSANLASLETLQLIALVTGVAGIHDVGVQRYRYVPGHLESDPTRRCKPQCLCGHLTARGDKDFQLWGADINADKARQRQSIVAHRSPVMRVRQFIAAFSELAMSR